MSKIYKDNSLNYKCIKIKVKEEKNRKNNKEVKKPLIVNMK